MIALWLYGIKMLHASTSSPVVAIAVFFLCTKPEIPRLRMKDRCIGKFGDGGKPLKTVIVMVLYVQKNKSECNLKF